MTFVLSDNFYLSPLSSVGTDGTFDLCLNECIKLEGSMETVTESCLPLSPQDLAQPLATELAT